MTTPDTAGADYNRISNAWDTLTKSMINDPDWAWSVHCNLAIPIMDHLHCSHKAANLTAAALMRHVFHYDITTHKCYHDIIKRPLLMSPQESKPVADQQKIREYFIEGAYYSNKKYPLLLFTIGEPLNADSTLFRTIVVGDDRSTERTLVILNEEIDLNDFRLMFDPAADDKTAKAYTSVDPDKQLSDHVGYLENQVIGCVVDPKTHIRDLIWANTTNVFYNSMIMRDKKPYKGCVRCQGLISEESTPEKAEESHDATDFLSDLTNRIKNHDVQPASSTNNKSDKLQPIDTTLDPISSRIDWLNPETKDSLLMFLKVRNFFKPGGVYQNRRFNDEAIYIYQEKQPRFDMLSFQRKSNSGHDNSWILNINSVDVNDWVLIGIELGPINHKEPLSQNTKTTFIPGHIYLRHNERDALMYTGNGPSLLNGAIVRNFKRIYDNQSFSFHINSIDPADWTDITHKLFQ